MCAPAIIPIAMAAGSAMQAVGSIQQGQAARAAADENIQAAEILARDVYAQAEDDKQQLALSMLREKATGQAQAAAAGTRVGTGSNLDWENDLLETYVLDKAAIDENASRSAYGINRQIRLENMGANSAVAAGRMGAATSLLSGAGKASAQWYSQKAKA